MSEAGAAEPFGAGCASCFAGAGALSALAAVFSSVEDFCAAETAESSFGAACCSPAEAMPWLWFVEVGDTGLFWLASTSRSSELKLLTRAGDAGTSLWALAVLD